jgi:5-methylcytosine-specific restriction endonuclease McrA
VCGRQRERHTKEFCSTACAHASRWFKRKQEIARTGIAPSNDRAAKRYLVETYGYHCWRCQITEWLGEPIVLILDHINGNAFDYVLTNLRLLCSNCDSQMPTWKNRNHGKGRGTRKRQLEEKLEDASRVDGSGP